MQKLQKQTSFWIAVSIVWALFVAPHAMIVKVATDMADPFFWNLIRFSLVLLVCLPLIFRYWQLIVNKKALPWVIGSALCMATAITLYSLAISMSEASYVATVSLISPILLVLLTPLFTKEKISRKAVAGVTLAALGAAMIVLLPFALHTGGRAFYPLATLLILVNCLCYVLAMITMRKAHDHYVPLSGTVAVTSVFVVVFSAVGFWLFGDHARTSTDSSFLVAVLYSGLGVSLLARIVSNMFFERIGATLTSAVSYLEIFLAVILPLLILGESLSLTTVVGGILILLGMFVIQSRRTEPAKHHITWRHH